MVSTEMGVARISTAPTSTNPWGLVNWRGTRRRCYFDPARFVTGIYAVAGSRYVFVQVTRQGLIALHTLGQ